MTTIDESLLDPHKSGTCFDATSPGFMPIRYHEGVETISCRACGSWVEIDKALNEVRYSDYPTLPLTWDSP